MVQLSATRCRCIAILWVSLVSFSAITLYVASQRVFIVVSEYFVLDSVRKLLDTPLYNQQLGHPSSCMFDWYLLALIPSGTPPSQVCIRSVVKFCHLSWIFSCSEFVHSKCHAQFGTRQCVGRTFHLRECIQKFPGWVDNEINNNKHSLRGNRKGYGGKTH
jgi:hypothetical protein